MQVEPLATKPMRYTHFRFQGPPRRACRARRAGAAVRPGIRADADLVFLSRETIVSSPTVDSGLSNWRETVVRWLSRNAGTAVEYFNLPANRVIELGSRVEI